MARRNLLLLTPTPIIADGQSVGADFQGGIATFFATGTFGGATVTLQTLSPDGATWLPVFAGITAAGLANFSAPAGKLRVAVTGSTTPSLQAWVCGIPTNNGG